ncbi:MAG: protein kinase [Deltaproteobacteria bacterium]|nr:protein kinase [Deltaproteobacteria bacterium]
MELSAGTVIGSSVRLVRLLGEGAMGSVWVAHHLRLETRVAVKFMSADLPKKLRPALMARFEREAKAAAKIGSPHVVDIKDQGVTEDGTPFIVMELLQGEDLGKRLKRGGALGLAEAARIVTQVAKALAAAHKVGIVHRDIKPENIFLVGTDDEPFVKVLDFGIAKHVDLTLQEPGLTATGALMGTPFYLSPEMLLGAKAADTSADLWALAAVAYHMVTGRVPFKGKTLPALCQAILAAQLPPPSGVRFGLPPELDLWFARAMCRDAAARFGSAKELAQSFAQAAGGGRPVVPADPSDSGGYEAVQAGQPGQRAGSGPAVARCRLAGSEPEEPVAAAHEDTIPQGPALLGPALMPGGAAGKPSDELPAGKTELAEEPTHEADTSRAPAQREAAGPSLAAELPPAAAARPGAKAPGATPDPRPSTPWEAERTALLGPGGAAGAPAGEPSGPWRPASTAPLGVAGAADGSGTHAALPLGEAAGDGASQPEITVRLGAAEADHRPARTFSGAAKTLRDAPGTATGRRRLVAIGAVAAAVALAGGLILAGTDRLGRAPGPMPAASPATTLAAKPDATPHEAATAARTAGETTQPSAQEPLPEGPPVAPPPSASAAGTAEPSSAARATPAGSGQSAGARPAGAPPAPLRTIPPSPKPPPAAPQPTEIMLQR